jgi:hypothetical protein
MISWLIRVLDRVVRGLATGVLALLILFEEWGWEPLQRAVAWVARLPVLRQLEAAIARLPPYGALAVFAVPSLMLVPVKLVGLWLVTRGHGFWAVGLILAAKLGGTAVVARLFELTKPALMTLGWFAALHARWLAFKDPLLARVRASWVWRQGRAMRLALRRRWARWR